MKPETYDKGWILAYADAIMLDWRTKLMLAELSHAKGAKLSAWLAYKNDVKSVDVTTDPEHVNWLIPPEVWASQYLVRWRCRLLPARQYNPATNCIVPALRLSVVRLPLYQAIACY